MGIDYEIYKGIWNFSAESSVSTTVICPLMRKTKGACQYFSAFVSGGLCPGRSGRDAWLSKIKKEKGSPLGQDLCRSQPTSPINFIKLLILSFSKGQVLWLLAPMLDVPARKGQLQMTSNIAKRINGL